MPIQPILDPTALCQMREGVLVRNARLLAEDSPFADLYTPDPSKAFIEFDICHTLPDYLGPVGFGAGKRKGKDVTVTNFCGFFPDTLEASHESLLYQQLNNRHLLSAYDDAPSDQKKIRHDSIIGCIVATQFPRKPMQGWRVPGNAKGGTACIKACAVVFKLAKGINTLMGNHLTGKKEQSVSIEVTTPYDNMGVYVPSRDELVPLIDPGEEVFSAYTLVDGVVMPAVGKLPTDANPDGEQLLVVYGMNGQAVHFNGVGMTPNPAERTAKITRMNAEMSTMVAMCAESVPQLACGQKVTFSTGRVGEICRVEIDGTVRSSTGAVRRGTLEDPAFVIHIGRDRIVLNATEMVGMTEALAE